MSIRTPHQQRLDYWATVSREVAKTMSEEKWVVVQNIIATIICGAGMWQAMRMGYPVTSALSALSIALINGLTVGQIYRGIQFARAEDQHRASQGDGSE